MMGIRFESVPLLCWNPAQHILSLNKAVTSLFGYVSISSAMSLVTPFSPNPIGGINFHSTHIFHFTILKMPEFNSYALFRRRSYLCHLIFHFNDQEPRESDCSSWRLLDFRLLSPQTKPHSNTQTRTFKPSSGAYPTRP